VRAGPLGGTGRWTCNGVGGHAPWLGKYGGKGGGSLKGAGACKRKKREKRGESITRGPSHMSK